MKTCHPIRETLEQWRRDPSADLPDEVGLHLDRCPECRAWVDRGFPPLEVPEPAPGLSPEARRALLSVVEPQPAPATSPGPSRPQPHSKRGAALIIATLSLAAAASTLSLLGTPPRSEPGQSPEPAAQARILRAGSGSATAVNQLEREPLGTGHFVTPGADEQLVLQHTTIDAHVTSGTAVVTVHQRFANPFREVIDATYVLPLPVDAAVRSMHLICGERVIEGVIEERQRARRQYEEARQQGRRASLLEQMRQNLFKLEVSAICPGEAVEVEVEYVEAVTYRDGRYALAFPTTVGERYGGAGAPQVPALEVPAHQPAPTRGGREVEIAVTIDEGMAVASLWSDSHDVEVIDASHSTQVQLHRADRIPNKDFALGWTLAGAQPRAAAVVHPPEGGADGYLAVTLEPQILEDLQRQRARELLFVMDSSCSMRGQPWQTAVAAVELALDGMQPDDTFNLVRFSSAASSLFERPMPATEVNLDLARSWMSRFEGGGTDMEAGLLHSLQMPGDERALRLMLLLTDGYIGTERALVEAMDAQLGDARVFSLGIGSSVNRLLLESVAEIGRGDAIYQLPDTPLQETVDTFHQRIAHPAMTDIEVDFGSLEVYDLYPSRIPDAWIGQPVRVVGRYARPEPTDGEHTIQLRGEVDGEPYALTLPVDLDAATSHEAIPALWARQRIHDLTYDFLLDPDERRTQITETALAHHLVSDHTSLVALQRTPSTCGPATRDADVAHYGPQGTRLDQDARDLPKGALGPSPAQPASGAVVPSGPGVRPGAPPADQGVAEHISSSGLFGVLAAPEEGDVMLQALLPDASGAGELPPGALDRILGPSGGTETVQDLSSLGQAPSESTAHALGGVTSGRAASPANPDAIASPEQALSGSIELPPEALGKILGSPEGTSAVEDPLGSHQVTPPRGVSGGPLHGNTLGARGGESGGAGLPAGAGSLPERDRSVRRFWVHAVAPSPADGAPEVAAPIQQQIKRYVGQLRYCYEHTLIRDPSVSGRLELSWTIEPSGAVSDVLLRSSTAGSPLLEDCVTRKIRRWRFPAAEVPVEITWPFVFRSE